MIVAGCNVGSDDTADSGLEPGSVEWKLDNAMSAGPEAIAVGATIMDWPTESGSPPTVLRAGTNGWVCYPASPAVPVNDPKCLDQVARLWSQGVETGEASTLSTMGVGYMLAGGGTASVSDPSSREPSEGGEWRVEPGHATLHFPPGALDAAGLPESPDVGGPWVMWASTPWAHVMVPFGPTSSSEAFDLEAGTPEWDVRNAESAAPDAVSAEATVVSWAAGAGSEPLVLQYYDRFYPSISLQIAAKSLNLDNNDVRVNLAESVELGSLTIKTDTQLQMNTFFYSDINGPAFQVDSFYDVFTGSIPIEKYKGKIVLIGATATGVGTPQVTPIDSAMAPVLTLAHSVSSILNEDFFIEPEWGFWARMGTFLVVMLYLMLVMPRLKAGVAFVVTVVLVMGLVVTHYILMTGNTMWIQLMTPGALLVIG